MNVCIVSSEFIGPVKNGGIATATSALLRKLAADGHKVTLLYTLVEYGKPACGDHPWHYWVDTLKAEGVALYHIGHSGDYYSWRAKAWHVKEFLGQNDFDLVYFNEHHGSGYYALCAKRAGLLPFAEQLHCVITHGSMEWVFSLNDQFISSAADVEIMGLERCSVEMADVVITPSSYLANEYASYGWRFPKHTFQQPYPMLLRSAQILEQKQFRVDELVFFGRLETRKGLWLFCDALDRLSDKLVGKTVTFLGRMTNTAGISSRFQIISRSHHWKFQLKLLTDFDQTEALDYLSGKGRLAVMPSLADNSPCVIYECIERNIPFVSTRGSGADELVDPKCWSDMLIEPTVDGLVFALANALDNGPVFALPRFDPTTSLEIWSKWHRYISTHRHELMTSDQNPRLPIDRKIGTSNQPTLVFVDVGKCTIGTLIRNVGSHIKRFGAIIHFIIFSNRGEPLKDVLSEILSKSSRGISVEIISPDTGVQLIEKIAESRIVFFADVDVELLTPFFVLASDTIGSVRATLTTCVVATKRSKNENPKIETLPVGNIMGSIGSDAPASGSVWAATGSFLKQNFSVFDFYDNQLDEIIPSALLGALAFSRCKREGISANIIPIIGAIEELDFKQERVSVRYRDLKRLAGEMGIPPLAYRGGPAWFGLCAFAPEFEPEIPNWRHALPDQHPLNNQIKGSDLALAAAAMGRAELALQLAAANDASAMRVNQIIRAAADHDKGRPAYDLSRFLQTETAKDFGLDGWLVGLKDNVHSGVSVFFDGSRILLNNRRIQSVPEFVDGIAKLIFLDVLLSGHAQITTKISSFGSDNLELTISILDQNTGHVVDFISSRLSSGTSHQLPIALHNVYGYSAILFEFTNAINIDIHLDSILVA